MSELKKEMSEDFLKQTAKDYDLSLDIVKSISKKYSTEEFYEKLDEELVILANSQK